MPAFSYEAIDSSGRKQRGIIESGNLAGARRALRERKLLPVSVTASHGTAIAGGIGGGRLRWLDRIRGRGVSSRALSTATRQLSTLIGSDVRIDEALRLVAAQGESAALTAVLLDVRGAVMEGSSFAAGLGRHPDVIPDFYRASISAGEKSGRLREVLAYLAGFVQARHTARQKLQLALLYPALLASVSAMMMTLMMIYVVPDIVKVFVTRGADLPLLTRMLIAISNAINSYGVIIILVLAFAVWLIRRQLALPQKRMELHRILATRPPFSRFSRQVNAARFAATLATLVQSRVPLLDALNSAAAVIPNRYIRAQAEVVASQVREGESLQHAMRRADSFPSMLVAIVASGESSGKLGDALESAATELDREVEAQVAVLVSLVEPAVLLAMGGLVLLMVMAILMPIIGLNDLAVS